MSFAIFAHEACHAEWYWTHGHSGHPAQASDRVQANGLSVKGDGVQGQSVWVHYAPPTVGEVDRKVRYIKIRYTLNVPSIDSNIGSIHIYNGEVKVKEFNSGWPSPVAGIHEPTFDLVTAQAFDKGLGVSVRIDFGYNAGYDSILIHGVGADFRSAPIDPAINLLLLEEAS